MSLSKKYVLILGAGLMQRPAIEACRELGFNSLVVDANPDALCVPFADWFEPIDLKDRETLLVFAKKNKNKIAGVFTCGTDFSASVSYICENLNLPSHSFKASLNATDKSLMRGCFKDFKVPSPDFSVLHRNQISAFVTEQKIKKINYPKVIKPVDNMGARGCRIIRNFNEFIPAAEEAVLSSKTQRAILEDYMKGSEFSIDAVVYKGTLTVTGFADRHIYFPPYFIEMGHTMPSAFSDSDKDVLINTFADGIHSLGLSCGVAKADIKLTEKGPMIGEIAARLSGGYMSGWTFPYASGHNLTKSAMKISCGMIPEELLSERKKLNIKNKYFKIYEIPSTGVSAERAYISIPGKIKKIYGAEKASLMPYIKNYFPRAKEGGLVDFPRNNVQKCGNFISLSSDYDSAVNAAEDAVSEIVLRLAPNLKITEDFLNAKTFSHEKGFPVNAFDLDINKITSAKDFVPVIKSGSRTEEFIPLIFQKKADNITDYNHRTLRKTLKMFDQLCPEHKDLDSVKFWTCLIRGGIQGILYYADSK